MCVYTELAGYMVGWPAGSKLFPCSQADSRSLKIAQQTKNLKSLHFSSLYVPAIQSGECDFNSIYFKFKRNFSAKNTPCVFSTKLDVTALPGQMHMGIFREYTS